MIVGYSSDEIIFGGANLINDPSSWHVVITYKSAYDKMLPSVMKQAGITSWEICRVPMVKINNYKLHLMKHTDYTERLVALSRRPWALVLTYSEASPVGCERAIGYLVNKIFDGHHINNFLSARNMLSNNSMKAKDAMLQIYKIPIPKIKVYKYETIFEGHSLTDLEQRICCFDVGNEKYNITNILTNRCRKGDVPLTLGHCFPSHTKASGEFTIEKVWKSKGTSDRLLIVFAVFGDLPVYINGIERNILLARKVYPNWTCRFYVDDSVPKNIVAKAIDLGAQVYIMKDGLLKGARRTMWRFLPLAESCRFISRDVDSRVNGKEAWAVGEWKHSGKLFHTMWDGEEQGNTPILAGMWGAVSKHKTSKDAVLSTPDVFEGKPLVPDIARRILEWKMDGYRSDEMFLMHHILPIAKRSIKRHGCAWYPRPFFDGERIQTKAMEDMVFKVKMKDDKRIGDKILPGEDKPDDEFVKVEPVNVHDLCWLKNALSHYTI